MIPLSNIYNLQASVNRATIALETGMLSGTGPQVREFEAALAAKVGRAHAVAVANGTLALELALRVLGIGPGDEVLVPALTFVAPAAAVRAVGAEPVFVDIHPDHWTIDPARLSDAVTTKTITLIAVDLLGHPCDYDGIFNVWRVNIIEDAAEAHGALWNGYPVGSLCGHSVFSFHANKTVTTGEGGAYLTSYHAAADKARKIANHGMTKERPYYHDLVGSNYRMSNLHAAYGVGQIEEWDRLVDARRAVAAQYDSLLGDLFQQGDLYRRPVATWATEAPWLYTVAHPNRDRIVEYLRSKDIDARAIWPALCDLPLYARSARFDYPVARRISREAFWLPTWGGMPKELIEQVADAVREAVKEGVKI